MTRNGDGDLTDVGGIVIKTEKLRDLRALVPVDLALAWP